MKKATSRPATAASASHSFKSGALAGGSMGVPDGSLSFEISKLQNELKVKERDLDQAHKEVTTLKSAVASKERMLQQKGTENDKLKDQTLKAQGEHAMSSKELATLRTDKRKLESSVSDLQRTNEKLKERVAQLSNKGPGFSDQVASLQADIKMVKKTNHALTEDNKAHQSALRAKDKELSAAQHKLQWAAQIETRNGELENRLLALKKELDDAHSEMRTLQTVQRQKESDIVVLTKALDTTKAALDHSRSELLQTAGNLKASEARCSELSTELNVTRDELVRTSAVAARVAASEAKAGLKAEGTVSLGQHVEEVKHLNGLIGQLKERLALAERDLSVAHNIKEKYRTALEGSTSQASFPAADATAAPANSAAPASATKAKASPAPASAGKGKGASKAKPKTKTNPPTAAPAAPALTATSPAAAAIEPKAPAFSAAAPAVAFGGVQEAMDEDMDDTAGDVEKERKAAVSEVAALPADVQAAVAKLSLSDSPSPQQPSHQHANGMANGLVNGNGTAEHKADSKAKGAAGKASKAQGSSKGRAGDSKKGEGKGAATEAKAQASGGSKGLEASKGGSSSGGGYGGGCNGSSSPGSKETVVRRSARLHKDQANGQREGQEGNDLEMAA